MKEYYAPKVKVRAVVNDLERTLKKIGSLWEVYGFGHKEIVFWAQNRSILHTMHDDIIRKYKVVRKVTY
jgi:hypothetical protein